jgi:hypothetical protein
MGGGTGTVAYVRRGGVPGPRVVCVSLVASRLNYILFSAEAAGVDDALLVELSDNVSERDTVWVAETIVAATVALSRGHRHPTKLQNG